MIWTSFSRVVLCNQSLLQKKKCCLVSLSATRVTTIFTVNHTDLCLQLGLLDILNNWLALGGVHMALSSVCVYVFVGDHSIKVILFIITSCNIFCSGHGSRSFLQVETFTRMFPQDLQNSPCLGSLPHGGVSSSLTSHPPCALPLYMSSTIRQDPTLHTWETHGIQLHFEVVVRNFSCHW